MANSVEDFDSKPSKAVLMAIYKEFKKLKVGICYEEKLEMRYNRKQRYKKLENWNIFCTATMEVARMIEQDVKEILFDDDKCANSHLDSDGTKDFLFSYDHEANLWFILWNCEVIFTTVRCE